jgi:hypothetical protein
VRGVPTGHAHVVRHQLQVSTIVCLDDQPASCPLILPLWRAAARFRAPAPLRSQLSLRGRCQFHCLAFLSQFFPVPVIQAHTSPRFISTLLPIVLSLRTSTQPPSSRIAAGLREHGGKQPVGHYRVLMADRPAPYPTYSFAAESGFRSDSDFKQHPDDTAGNNLDTCPDGSVLVGRSTVQATGSWWCSQTETCASRRRL